MILQSLVGYYETLAKKGLISRPGWANVKVSYALEIDENGELLQIHLLKSEKQVGKKTVLVPREMNLPIQFKRSGSQAPSYFLCDNSQYCLGIENGIVTEKSMRCFKLFATYHLSMLSDIETLETNSLCKFVEKWNPKQAMEHPVIKSFMDYITAGGNFIFMFSASSKFFHELPEISEKWEKSQLKTSEEIIGTCLATGNKTEIARIHNSVKGLYASTLSPNGWTLVGFDKEAFESYGKTQSYNAPVGKYASFAYTTALNYLLSDRKHVNHIGDTTLVYWAENADPIYQNVFSSFLNGESADNTMTDSDISYFIDAITNGKQVNWDGIPINPDNKFYILGLSPNAARISVRFFFRDCFGNLITHIKAHYRNLEIIPDRLYSSKNIPLWKILNETVRIVPGKAAPETSPQLSGDILRAILTGSFYPATMYQQIQIRIKAEQNVNHNRAAIIKAYLLRNTNNEKYKEALTVELNEKTIYQPYVLGRLFSTAVTIQELASGVNTIKDRYFSSASTTPSVVFPIILKLAENHLKKLDGKLHDKYANQLIDLVGLIKESYPAHYSLYDQGIFQLGYYHQTQKRYEKKDKVEIITEEIKEDK